MSLNAKIARTDGSVDWLESIPNPDNTDYGYNDFYASIDTTIQGFKTYQQIMDWNIPFPYADKDNYVLTTRQDLKNTKYVQFISENHFGFIQKLKDKVGQDIWLIGGGKINTMLFNEGLIDEIRVFVMPIVISDGINIFETFPKETILHHLETKTYPTGAIEIKYRVEDNMIMTTKQVRKDAR